MYIMGMKGFNYYFSWFCRYFIVYFIVNIICSAIIVSQLTSVPFYMPFILLLLIAILLIFQSFFIQIFMTNSKIGIIIALLFFSVQFILSFITTNSDNPTTEVNTIVGFSPHAAIVIAFQTMLYADAFQITPSFLGELNNYVIVYAVISVCINIVVYMLLVWYLDQVLPNEFGTRRHPLFCWFSKQLKMSR